MGEVGGGRLSRIMDTSDLLRKGGGEERCGHVTLPTSPVPIALNMDLI